MHEDAELWGPPADAELWDLEGMPVSRERGAVEGFVWTPDPKPASDRTLWRAVTEGSTLDRQAFDALRRSFSTR